MPSASAPTIALALLAFALPACKVLKPKDDPTRHYRLEGSTLSKLTTGSDLRVLLGGVVIPGYIDRKEIVTSAGGGELQVAEFHVWAENMEEAISRVLAENVSRLLDSPLVVPYPEVDSSSYDFRVPVLVRRFEQGADGKVYLDVSYAVASSDLDSQGDGDSEALTITKDVAAPGSYSDIVAAMNAALADLSKQLARHVLRAERERKAAEAEKEETDPA